MAVIKKKSLVDQVYERLREDILTLRLPLGGKVNVNELQSALGVSCTPIREAVNRLQQEGLVVYENNVGAHVLTLDEHDVEEIQQLAMTLHCAAIRLAMERGDRAVIAAGLRRYAGEFRQAKSPQAQVSAVNHLVGVFYHNCGNRRLDRSMISIQGQQLLLRYIYASTGSDVESDGRDFDAICRYASEGNVEKVCAVLSAYTGRFTQAVLRYVRAKRGP